MPVVSSSIGDIAVSLVFQDGRSAPDFCDFSSPGHVVLRVHRGRLPGCETKEVVFDSRQTWALFRCKEKYVLQNDAVESDTRPDTIIVLDPDLRRGQVYVSVDMTSDCVPDPLPYPLNQVLMIMLLSQGRGLLVHACGVDDNGAGYLFSGNSGHGKSTMAGLWHENGLTVLNDDRIVVREKDGEFWIYGTPWNGDFKRSSARGVPLRRLFFLSKSAQNFAAPGRGLQAVCMLLARSFPPLWDENGMTFTMDFCHRLVEKVPCYELNFVPDSRVLDFVRNLS